MALAFLLALQAAAGAPAPAPPQALPGVTPLDFDLAEAAKRQSEAGCGQPGAGEIVVCGRRPGTGDYPMDKWERVFREGPLLAEKQIGRGAVARAYVEQVEVGIGQVSKRAMVGVKIGF